MRILVRGAAGFIGARLAMRLIARDWPALPASHAVEFVFSGVRPPAAWPAAGERPGSRFIGGNLLDPALLPSLFGKPFDRVFHLAAALTLDAETDFARCLELNVQALIRLLECCRGQACAPRFVFASSISSFGGPLPAVVNDHVVQTPQTSYGVHKVIAEQLINDYSRRGLVDGRVLRLPIVLTHPGPAGSSVSDRVAALIREPLQGGRAVCPIAPDTALAVASVDRVVARLLRIADLPTQVFVATRAMNLPALTVTPAQLAEAVRCRQPTLASDCIRFQHEPALQRVVDGWPSRFTSQLATEHGIIGDATVDELVATFQPALAP